MSLFKNLPEYNQKSMCYTGIGSRNTPHNIQVEMANIAIFLQEQGFTLRSGGALGADKAFEGKIQPWSKIKDDIIIYSYEEGFRQLNSPVKDWSTYKKNLITKKEIYTKEDADEISKLIAQEIHPAKNKLKDYALELMARNVKQVFGNNLDTPSDFVLFYAKETENSIRPEGGTGQAVEIARRKKIPCINMINNTWKEELKGLLGLQICS